MNIKYIYKKWLDIIEDAGLKNELIAMTASEIDDAFHKNLEFGTGGLRGIIGAGTNRMNVFTIRRAAQGLCNYLKSKEKNSTVAIAFDNRINSELFARSAAEVIAGNGAKAFIFPEMMPTPVLSYAVRALGCDAGIVITASHNPAEYNGFKVYGNDGCQITLRIAEGILKCIEDVDIFEDVKTVHFDAAVQEDRIRYISPSILEDYLDRVLLCSINPKILEESDLIVIYTPLNGAGNKPVREILARAGLKYLTVVPEQEKPDCSFLTCPVPNPEDQSAYQLAIALAGTIPADLLLATDPDCDRIGVAVKYETGYRLLTGNETGCLLMNYILSQKKEKNILPENPVVIKTIVTSAMADRIAEEYGARVINTLTGFKFIGEQIGLLEQAHEEDLYVFGFEESYGYLPEIFVRDKDAVSSSLLICEMSAFYKKNDSTLIEELEKLYRKHGYWKHKLLSFSFTGANGMQKMETIMRCFRRECFKGYAGLAVIKADDYLNSVSLNRNTAKNSSLLLPKSDVMVFSLENDCEIVIRPSGTEPKMKCYLTVKTNDSWDADQMLEMLEAFITKKINYYKGCV